MVYAGHNQLNSLPPDIDRLYQLEEINVEYNFIVALPHNIMLIKSLKVLNVRQNRLTALPGPMSDFEIFLPALRTWDASHNLVTEMPSGMTRLRNLEILSLSSNQIISTPRNMAGCTALTLLDLSMNRLNALPCVASCTALRSFITHGNRL